MCDSSFYSNGSAFADSFNDSLCKLNLKETSDFVKTFSGMNGKCSNNKGGLLIQRRRGGLSSAGLQKRIETPSTPGRPVFKFSAGNLSNKSVPSKWDDAEKWLVSSSCQESPAHGTKPLDPSKLCRQHEALQQKTGAFEVIGEKLRISEVKIHKAPVPDEAFRGFLSEILLKDPATENFLFKDYSCFEAVEVCTTEEVVEVRRRDVGTDMTPLGSLTTSRCHTPVKSSSPARHNTPADRSGPLVASNTRIDLSELKDCHFEKLQLGVQYDSLVAYWNSREEEEEEVSKSLRHSEVNGGRKSVTECRASLWEWEDDDRTKICIRYQREEAKIQAWMNLQTAKAEAQSRKLEVKIQNMRSTLEEKLMKRMAIVHRRAEGWRAAAQLQHSQQILRATEQAQRMRSSHFTDHRASCGCFPVQQ